MKVIDITNFRKNLFEMLENTIKYNEPVNIITKNWNAVIISEEEYNHIVETLYLMSTPKLKETLIVGKNTDFIDCICESDILF